MDKYWTNREKLIEELEKESKMLRGKHGRDTIDHSLTIEFLKTGVVPVSGMELEEYETLNAAIYDYEQLVDDYLT